MKSHRYSATITINTILWFPLPRLDPRYDVTSSETLNQLMDNEIWYGSARKRLFYKWRQSCLMKHFFTQQIAVSLNHPFIIQRNRIHLHYIIFSVTQHLLQLTALGTMSSVQTRSFGKARRINHVQWHYHHYWQLFPTDMCGQFIHVTDWKATATRWA